MCKKSLEFVLLHRRPYQSYRIFCLWSHLQYAGNQDNMQQEADMGLHCLGNVEHRDLGESRLEDACSSRRKATSQSTQWRRQKDKCDVCRDVIRRRIALSISIPTRTLLWYGWNAGRKSGPRHDVIPSLFLPSHDP